MKNRTHAQLLLLRASEVQLCEELNPCPTSPVRLKLGAEVTHHNLTGACLCVCSQGMQVVLSVIGRVMLNKGLAKL